MNNKMNFIIPDFLNVEECTYTLSTLRLHPEVFRDNINIIGFTGMFPGCVWNNKGKKFDMYRYDMELVKRLRIKYNDEENISLILIFDNEEISSNELDDEYANEVIKIFNNKKNYVLCKSKKLRSYIKEHYKEVKVIDYYENSDDDSEFIIINPKDNKCKDILKSKDKNKYILMPDLGFIPNRQNLFKHSKKDSILNKINPKKDKYNVKESNKSFYEIKKDKNYLSYRELVEYSKNGINTFMLSGVGVYNVASLCNIADYLINEDYQSDYFLAIFGQMNNLIEYESWETFNYRL